MSRYITKPIIILCYIIVVGILLAQSSNSFAEDSPNYDASLHTYNLLQYITEHNLVLSWDSKYRIGLIRKDSTVVSFQPGLPILSVNFTGQIFVEPIVQVQGKLLASENFLRTLDSIFISKTYILPQNTLNTKAANTAVNSTNNSVASNNSNSNFDTSIANTEGSSIKLLNSPLIDKTVDVASPYLSNNSRTTDVASNFSRIVTVVIDPGHGGKTPGAVGRFSYKNKQYRIMEKDVVLDVSLRVSKQLAQKFSNVQVVLTRESDKYVSLEDRTIFANKYLNQLKEGEGMLFVSIHANAALTSKASGYEVWYLPPDYRRNNLIAEEFNHSKIYSIINSLREEEITIESAKLADFVIEGLETQIGTLSRKRGVKEEKFYVVRNTKMPAVLVELGFITNPQEGYYLTLDSYKKKLSKGIVNGLARYLQLF